MTDGVRSEDAELVHSEEDEDRAEDRDDDGAEDSDDVSAACATGTVSNAVMAAAANADVILFMPLILTASSISVGTFVQNSSKFCVQAV